MTIAFRHRPERNRQLLIRAKEEIKSLRDELNTTIQKNRKLSQLLYQQDRCNYCYDNNFVYKHTCTIWMKKCFPDFLEEEDMEV